ncbi:MAG: hypothetical protein R3E54_09265 [Halioglobus sp.]
MFRRHGRRCDIRYNPWIFAKYFEENLRDTVHEVYTTWCMRLAVAASNLTAPSGAASCRRWVRSGVTFNLDLDDIPQRLENASLPLWLPAARAVSTRHNRVQRGRGLPVREMRRFAGLRPGVGRAPYQFRR